MCVIKIYIFFSNFSPKYIHYGYSIERFVQLQKHVFKLMDKNHRFTLKFRMIYDSCRICLITILQQYMVISRMFHYPLVLEKETVKLKVNHNFLINYQVKIQMHSRKS